VKIAPVRGAEHCDQPVCLCVYLSVWTDPHKTVLIPFGRSLVLIWQRCTTLCTSGFMNDVTFGRNGGDAERWRLHSATVMNDVVIEWRSLMSMNTCYNCYCHWQWDTARQWLILSCMSGVGRVNNAAETFHYWSQSLGPCVDHFTALPLRRLLSDHQGLTLSSLSFLVRDHTAQLNSTRQKTSTVFSQSWVELIF